MRTGHVIAALAASVVITQPASGAVLYDNLSGYNLAAGTSSFSSSSGPGGWIAQAFTLASASTLDGFSFVTGSGGLNSTDPRAVSWKLLAADGALPGELIASDTMSGKPEGIRLANVRLGATTYYMNQWQVALPQTILEAGSYYLALHVTTSRQMFMANGTRKTGHALSQDDGASWRTMPFGDNSYAIAINGQQGTVAAVPEPATWAMMLLGFAVVGYGLRRRSRIEPQTSFTTGLPASGGPSPQ